MEPRNRFVIPLENVMLLGRAFLDISLFTRVLRIAAVRSAAFRKHLTSFRIGTGAHSSPDHLMTYFARGDR